MNEEKELHLFIIWEKARHLEKEVINEISNHFTIAQTFSITWSPYQVANNFTRFYGASLPKGSRKELHCGIGEFKLVVVHDLKPKYDLRPTSKGMRTVNVNMFDTKAKLRELSGGGHKIHGTDNVNETKHDLVLLTGLSVDDFLIEFDKRKPNISMRDDLMGCHGWNTFKQLFYVLNECSDYLVLRNFENINIDYFNENRSDIDILAEDSSEIKYVLGDLVNLNNNNEHMYVSVEHKLVMFEIYQCGMNLYHSEFEKALFRNKIITNNIHHPNKEMEMYALIYHALLMKKEFSEKHKQRIFNKYDGYLEACEKNEAKLLVKLIDYFDSNEFFFVMPDVGYFNLRPEIESKIIENKNRDNPIKRKIKKILNVEMIDRQLNIVALHPISTKLYIEANIFNKFEIKFRIGMN